MSEVFISYEHESKLIADNICSVLEQNKIRCWYAPRDVIGDYATSIVEAISKSKIFILVLNEHSSNSQHCLNEVEIAYKANISGNQGITIMPFRVDNKDLSMAMEYYVKRLHWIDAANRSIEVAVNELLSKVLSILRPMQDNTKVGERIDNKYFVATDTKEINRLKVQSNLLKSFEQDVYDNAVNNKSNVCVLDLGCNNGDLIMDRIGNREEVSRIIGIEYEEQTVDEAKNKYANSKFSVYRADVESDEFEQVLIDALTEQNAKGFDIVCISMLFLHLKKPYKVIRIVRKYMNGNAIIIVRDIDDGLNYAYPDENADFERAIAICSSNETSGYRKSGRQIYSLLVSGGMSNVKLEKCGLNSIGMNYEEKQALFDTYFSFIMEDLILMNKRYPDNAKISQDLEWYKSQYDNLNEKFHSNEFVFNLGFMLYSANK